MRRPIPLVPLAVLALAVAACGPVLGGSATAQRPLASSPGGAADVCRGVEGATGPRQPHPSSGPPGLDVSRDVRTYSVSAEGQQQLRTELTRMGPITSTGRRVDAYAAWRIRKRYEPQVAEDGTCTTGPVAVRVGLEYAFPAWSDREAADPALQRKWDTYLTALDAHERGHECIGLQAASELKRTLEALPAHADCDALAAEVKRASKAVFDKWLAIESDYDRVTNNGRNEGASFP